MAEIEYQVDEMLFKMNSLTGSSNLPEKPMTDFTDSDTTYGEDVTSSCSEVRHSKKTPWQGGNVSFLHFLQWCIVSIDLKRLCRKEALKAGCNMSVADSKQPRHKVQQQV